MKFSIIVVSRARPDMLEALLRSIQENTAEPDEIECLVGFDNDDIQSHEWVDSLTEDFGFNIYFSFEPRDYNIIAYENRLAFRSSGVLLFVLNDDCLILTPQWDKLAYTKFIEYTKDGNQIFYGKTNCTSVDKINQEYAAFPIISRYAIDKLGFFISPHIRWWCGDLFIHQVYAKIGRICDLNCILIDHITHNSVGIGMPNPGRQEMLDWHHNNKIGYFDDYNKEIGKISEYIQRLIN